MTTLVARNGGLLIRDGGLAAADDPCVCCTPPCGTSAESGGAGVTVNTYAYPSDEGEVEFFYDAYSVPDAFKVEGGGQVFVDTGSVSGSATIRFCKPSGVTELKVTVTGPDGTAWNYTIGCPDSPCDLWYVDCYPVQEGVDCGMCLGGPFMSSEEANEWIIANPPPAGCEHTIVHAPNTHTINLKSALDHEPNPEELRRETERLQQSLNNPLP